MKVPGLILVSPFPLVLLLYACRTPPASVAPRQAHLPPSTAARGSPAAKAAGPAADEKARLVRLEEGSASIRLETLDWTRLRIVEPTRSDPVPIPDLAQFLRRAGLRGGPLATVQLPSSWALVDAAQKTGDEIAIDIAEELRAAGFARVVFVTFSQGLLTELYPRGLPTRDEALRAKEEFIGHGGLLRPSVAGEH